MEYKTVFIGLSTAEESFFAVPKKEEEDEERKREVSPFHPPLSFPCVFVWHLNGSSQ